ncbi:MAG: acyl-CoA synthetase FdrA [Defluviicoccus sp.]|nr:acyl-CoA synthetase FdrA [Defluviicoccus sp.]MDE0382758.1 acyl-CoA synthetase FdrA [Defluviicoccus sp.]
MATETLLLRGLFRDSVTLMQLAAALEAEPGIARASVAMASPANLAMLAESGVALESIEARANDLLVVVEGDDADALAAALERAAAMLDGGARQHAAPGGEAAPPRPRSLAEAVDAAPDATLALISCPGEYAAAEAMKALRLGLDAMVFSDNVSLDDEVALKREAARRGRLLMGPDCGTAIVGGVPLGFANRVRRGAVGIVGASGTGLQQVACLVDRHGAGISHAIGAGGRDLSRQVGGTTTLRGLAMLAADPGTDCIVLVSKPPDEAVMRRLLDAAGAAGKPVIACFVGARPPPELPANLRFAATLDEAAALAAGTAGAAGPGGDPPVPRAAGPGRLVGLFSGGTLCYEAQAVAAPLLGRILSNAPLDPSDAWDGESGRHLMLDLGDDAFTRGRPHPMIDYRPRLARIRDAAAAPGTAAILIDVVLGCGAHGDPAAALAPAIGELDGPVAVGSVCGTEADPQRLSRQEAALADAGMVVAASNAQAARIAARIAGGGTA